MPMNRNASKSTGITKSVLFIGNSFTSVNDLPKTVSEIAHSLGDTVKTDMYAPGGYTLRQDSTDTVALSKIKSKAWDFVVLQEQSELPAVQDSRVSNEVIPYALKLSDNVREASPTASVVFFQTWGYKDGDPEYCKATPTLCDYKSMQDQLSRSYGRMAQQSGGLPSPVGEAWRLTRATHPEIELYQSDGKHPSVEGTYLAAAVFYMTLFQKDVTGASSLNIDPGHAKILRQIAKQIVSGQ